MRTTHTPTSADGSHWATDDIAEVLGKPSPPGPARFRGGSFLDLAACAAWLLAGVLLLAVAAPEPVRAAIAIPLVLVVPGYAFIAAAFGPLLPDFPLRLVLAAALSLGIDALGVVVLDAGGVELDRSSFTYLVVGVGAICLALAVVRRWRCLPVAVSGPRGRLPVLPVVLVVATVSVVIVGLLLAQPPRPAASISGYSTLWVLPGESGWARVGTGSNELRSRAYRAEVISGGEPIRVFQFGLEPGGHWRGRFRLPLSRSVEVRLYRLPDQSTVYRRVRVPPVRG